MDLSSAEISRALKNLKLIDPREYDELIKLASQLGEMEEIDKAKTDFLAFVRLVWPGAILGRHHKEMARVVEGVVLGDMKRAIVNMAPRMPYALDTPVPTPVGWKTIGTLEIGDMVFGPDGKPVRVVGKSPVMRKPLYEVETVDGCKIVCSDDHEWHVRIGRQGYHRRTTEELYVRQVTAKKWFKSPFLLPGKPVEYRAQELPVDPYVLGVWLGDGHNKQAVITSHDDDAPQIRAQFESRGYETTDQTTHMTFGVKKLRVALRELGVLGNKHIPEQYLLGSVAQRMDLLRGLMDTDGCVQKNGQCVFSQKKRAIVESVRMLVLSLGGKCRVYSVPAILRGVYYGEQWVIAFSLKDCCYLERKKSRTRDNRVSRSIRVKPLGVEGDVQCIEVDSKEGLFQGPDYCVVTNSKSEFFSYLMPAWLLGQKPDSKVIQICGTGDMAIGWSRKVRNLINTPEYQKIFPGVKLRQDSKAAGRWHTSHNGEYFAVGAEGNVTGRGGNVIIIDDPTGEQQAVTALTDPSVYRKVYDWYIAGPRQRLQPNGRICVVQCVAEGQRVLMADGTWRPVETVRPGDSVVGYDSGVPVPRKVSGARCSGNDDILKLVTRSTELRVNAKHPLLVVRGGAEKSPVNQEQVRQAQNWSVEWVPASDLKVGDMVVAVKELSRGNYHRPMRFDRRNQMTQEDYWFIGFMFGDGWLINSGDRGITGFCWAYGIHEDLNERALAAATSLFGRSGKKTKFGYWRYDHQEAGRWLAKIGFSSGALKKRLPEWVFKLRACDKRAFIRGFGDADGWLRPTERVETWTIGIANRDLLDDLRLLARTCGVRVSKIYTEVVKENSPPNIRNIRDGICHRARFSFRENQVELASRYRRQSSNGKQHFRFERLEGIFPDGRAPVYDLSVEGAESFVAEGLVVHNSRWATNDFTGQLLKAERETHDPLADKWEVVELPAILPSGESIWPEFWSKAQLEATKIALPPHRWNAQYQQQPSASETALIKKDFWRIWPGQRPPECHFKLVTMDTAYSDKERADYTAVTTWGIFKGEKPAFTKGAGFDPGGQDFDCLILLDAWKARINFPELKAAAHKHWLKWQPDVFMVETKASGTPLIHELRARGIPISEYTPTRGTKLAPNSKVVRVNAVTDILASGIVYAPELRWAEEVIEECADFPQGEHDDYVDCVVMALSRFRQGGLIRLPSDEDWNAEPNYYRPRRFY